MQPILQVITATHRRGAEVYAVDLCDELRRRGLPMELVALTPGAGDAPLDVPTLGATRIAAMRALRRRAVGLRGILAHGSSTLPAAVVATAGRSVPFVYRSIGDPRYWSERPDRRWRVGVELRRARAVVPTFPGAADELIRRHRLDPARVPVIANARALDRFPPATPDQRVAARRALLPGVAGPVVLVLGALAPEKDPVLAVATAAQLPDVHLLVVGDGPEAGAVDAYAAAVAPGRVHRTGSLADPRTAYLAADAVLVTSRTEGFPGVALEAGLSGVPTVTVDVGGVREAVLDGVTGRVVPARRAGDLADALRQVLADAPALGDAARAHCRDHFSMEAVGAAWAELLERVLP